jgi:pimeloyl-ACP methyl ester carboxylesterase
MTNQRILVLLRGLVREQRHWQDFPDILHSYFPDDKFILYDFPGNGRRYKETSATSITDMVNDVRAFVRKDTKQPVYIIALSIGAMVAVEWANKHPDEYAGAVLISTSLGGLNPFYKRLLPSTYPTIIKSLIFPADITQKEMGNLNLVSNIIANDETKRDAVINHWVSYAKQYTVSRENGFRQLISAMRYRVPRRCSDVQMFLC